VGWETSCGWHRTVGRHGVWGQWEVAEEWGERERERESGWQRRWDGEDSVPARTRHPPPRGLPAGAGDEARGGVLASLPLKEEEGGPRLNDMWALLKCDSKDN
jgi:hypothetical protein